MTIEVPEGSVPLRCPKCGETKIDQYYAALVSATNEYFEAPTGEVFRVDGELELINTVEEMALSCVSCGHEMKSERKLKRS